MSILLVSPDKIVGHVRRGGKEKRKNRAAGLPSYQEVLHLYDVVEQLGVPVAMEPFAALNVMVSERIAQIKKNGGITQIVYDLEPSNGTLQLLRQAKQSVDRFSVMKQHRTKWNLIARAAGWPDIARFASKSEYVTHIESFQAAYNDFLAKIQDPNYTSFIIVSSPEDIVLKETTRLRRELEKRGFPVAAIVFNKDYQHMPADRVNGTTLEHTPQLHERNVRRYIAQSGFKGSYFSVPLVPELEVVANLSEKRIALERYIKSIVQS
ncbi:MAG: arsenical pump-driving ATPase GET3 [Nanoarchaeota archaeon]|nr:arsenical pump-driving ATPase GET3 [Nanoarchaeota archaeon]MBU1005908.1 arsenical pump-driving ATPase GET3 [Nanoarchaeota archaeon]MBU1945387.1 arsenical pump-driving ATPase GET3 [Nanoarchaeota archaeon]